MPIPHLPQVRIALWEELESAGGTGSSQDVINILAERFQITALERQQRDPSGNRTFDHRVHSAIAQSRKAGWIDSFHKGEKGFWRLTEEYYEDNPAVD